MLNRIHLLSSPLNKNKDSKYCVLYGAQATSCGYGLENKEKKEKQNCAVFDLTAQ